MKNLLVFLSQNKKFEGNSRYNYNPLVRIQIDNSLDLGWKKEDILLITNFKYEYNGIHSIVITDDKLLYKRDMTSTKIIVISSILNSGIDDSLYWYHDFDVYQNYVVSELELGITGFDLGLTTYGYKERWNCGCFFFIDKAVDIFNTWSERMIISQRSRRCDEKELAILTDTNTIKNNRYRVLDPTYNFNYKYTYITYPKAAKPLKVLHFNPYEIPRSVNNTLCNYSNLDSFMYGMNRTTKPFMSERLIRIFHEHGIR